MRVAMIGTGYVGLVSGTCFADFGHVVTCIDKDASKIDALNNGQIPIYEPGLQELVAKNVAEERLFFTTAPEEAIRKADAVFIAVGTPTRRGDGHADLSYVYAAAEEIARLIEGFTVIVTKSTVPVGTGDEVEAIIRKTNPDAEFAVVSNPEFLREGAAISDFKRPDRVVVGTDDERAVEVMRELYRPLYLNETPIIVTRRRTSELTKYAANAFLAVKITFINEIADLCEKVGANVQEVSRGIGLDNRIGGKFLHAGPGYGGSCFPKDTLALSRIAADAQSDLKIVDSVIEVNAARKKKMADKVIEFMGGDVSGKTIALLGLAFKPNTDDMREAPSIDIVEKLQAAGAKIRAYDPASMEEAEKVMSGVMFCDGPYHAIENADVVVIVTEWDQFRALDLDRVKTLVSAPKVVDLRNIYKPDYMEARGFEYTSVGRSY
ncbi:MULTISPECIES: UDP-glucose dehydrogenase family protein [Stappiaceae]|jgi:UDPglucose 6-dehydrogenase|uniref:UDP-glucose 6-dehydrogenase n=1 Tax=Roseibium aggregatum TaxID=187304 RepID=A0A0M6Y8U4_9HYPH|nr:MULTISPECIES: UDP-glucose/GDP-mannose dehydrogenase family protein [Stappiaceae]MEE2866811.1 UDP-glucose/GDP-mannose dehydrogenase family protein [Pseudomonadota bacterium]AMN54535.1 UDP-glucose 6-dehydrogenase [Labrenzia sp. CP4]MBN8179906.1 UDP-glucose/GDP-mannose dehydrogenase family protein [Roseibium aggregatum]MBO9457753.1 UDP-glucose/GDP-mannose dehydrogenase family protein [Labrenzia sp. R5_0]NKX62756.1 UDP-glucose/GDP-mannose dehydrogenase family protein [Labrenzia sp. 5N]